MVDRDATILVAGASGGTGRELLDLLASRPPAVRALTRSPEIAERLATIGADETVVGDLFDPDDARLAVDGVDIVVSAVGSGPRDVLFADEFVDGIGNQNLFEAAAAAGAEAVVMESALGVGDDPASLLGRLFDAAIRSVQAAKARAETTLRELPVRHTILRPGVLTNGRRTGDVQVARPGRKLWGAVSRADVAKLLGAAPFTDSATDRTFEVVRNPLCRSRADGINWQLP